ncbi:MAG TPA: MFS transporter, partial [Myxococcota bacterium]|nr:MFS transporter [Myxococcota bacterium]
YQLARIFLILGLQIQGVAVAWRMYALTGEPMDLGWIGLVQFLPVMLLWPLTGTLSDRYDRRLITIFCLVVHLFVALMLALAEPGPSGIFALLALGATGRAFAAPAQQALLPGLVTPDRFPRAVALNSTVFQLGSTIGPALGGLLYAQVGPTTTFGITAALMGAGIFTLALLPPSVPVAGPPGETVWQRFAQGLTYVRTRPVLLGVISLDLFAVLLGGAVALLPVFAKDILHAGPEGLGLLRAAPAIGATVSALWLAGHPMHRRAGSRLLFAVALFGFATVVFGLSTELWLSMLALLVLGAADEISVVIRQTVVQVRTPDALRGRVSAVNFLFISVSNEVGAFESGLTAAWWGPVTAVVLGGLGAMAVAGIYAWRFPELRKIDRLDLAD